MDDASLTIMQLGSLGLCCSQILMQLALDDMGEENVPLVRAMSGLCNGLGREGICGAASGAACVLALHGAKGSAMEEEEDSYQLMLAEFMEWFEGTAPGRWGGTSCEMIMDGSDKMEIGTCGDIITASRNKVLEILAERGLDPTIPKEERHG